MEGKVRQNFEQNFWQKIRRIFFGSDQFDMVRLTLNRKVFLVSSDCMATKVLLTGFLGHWYSCGCLCVTFTHYVVNHRKYYHIEVSSRRKIRDEFFDKTFGPKILPREGLHMVMMECCLDCCHLLSNCSPRWTMHSRLYCTHLGKYIWQHVRVLAVLLIY